jgi:hypothetical protein
MTDSTKMSSPMLEMKFAGRFIDLLGQQMYGGPVPAVAELITNAWDADSPKVEVSIPEDPSLPGSEIIVRDFGTGMTFKELNDYYLTIGYERRQRGQESILFSVATLVMVVTPLVLVQTSFSVPLRTAA